MVLAGSKLLHHLRRLVKIKTVAARFRHADVEPDGRIEAGLLRQHQMGQIHPEVLNVFFRFEVVPVPAPVGDRVDDTVDQLRYARLPLRSAHSPMKVLAGNNIGCRL